MDTISVLTVASALVATLFGLLVAILGWMGNKVYEKLSEMARLMSIIEKDLHGQISGIDRRVSYLEVKCESLTKEEK